MAHGHAIVIELEPGHLAAFMRNREAYRTRKGIKYVRFSEQDVLGAKRERVSLYNPTAAQSP